MRFILFFCLILLSLQNRLYSFSNTGTVTTTDTLQNPIEVMVQTGHRALYEAKFSDNDSVLFTYTRNGEIHAWDVQTMKQMRTYIGHSGNLVKFFVAKDQLVSCSNNKVFFWNQQNSTVQKVITLFDSSGAFTLSTHWAKQYNENYLLVKQSVNFANTAIPKDYDIGWKINLTNGTRERIHSNVFEHLDYVDPNHALLLSTFIDYDNPDTTFFVLKETKPLQWDTVWKKKAHELQLGKFYNYYPQLTNDGAYVYFNNQAGINMNTHEITDTIHAYKFFSIDGKPHNLNEQSIFYWFKYGNKWVANMHHQWKLLEFKNAQLTAQLIPPVQLDTIFEIHNKINPLQWYSENNYSHNETKEYNLFVSHAMDKYVVTDPNQIALFNPFEKLIRSANFKVSRPTAIHVSNTGKQFLIEAENKGGNERKLWEWELGAAFPKEIFEFSNRIPDSINLRYNIRFSDTMIAGSKYKVELPKSWKLSYFRGIESILLFNQQTGDTIALEGHVGDVTQWAMNADETLLASVSLKDVNAVTSNDIKVWRIDKKIEWKRMLDLSFNFNEMGTSSEPISQLAFSKNNQYLWGAYKSKLVQWEINTGIPQLEINAFAPFHLSTGDSLIAATTSLGQDILIYDNVHQQNKWILSGHSSNITDLKFINNNQFLVSSSSDGKTKVWNVQTGKEILNIIQFQDGLSYAMLTPANYYFGSRESINELNFVVNNKAYGYEQFDLALNRPDIVLQQIDQKTNNKLALALEEAWKKRVRRTGISEIAASKIPDISSLPSIQLISNTTIEDKLFLTFAFKAASGKIKGYQIKINSIPAYTGNGKMIGAERRENIFYDTLRLSEGNNYIQLYCFDENGMESLRQELTIEKNQSTSIASKRIFIGIGISTYQDAAYNLVYPDKDVEDLGRTFTIGNSLNTAEPFYNPLYQKIILKNDGASKAKVKALKEVLMNTAVDDEVIISFNGHGLIGDNLNFYFACYDMDFKNPAQKGLSYADIGELLEGIPARKRMVLMDACHSGPLDTDNEYEVATTDTIADGQRGVILTKKTRKGETSLLLGNTFKLMQDLFTDISTQNGSIIIAAAGGDEFAFENKTWKNGVFTFCMRKAIEEKKADNNKDGKIAVTEIKQYVSKQVEILTNGRQQPTSRQDNPRMAWILK